MSKKRMVVAILLLALAAGLFAANRRELAPAAAAAEGGQHGPANAAQPGHEIPEHITYDVLFRQIAALKRKADDLDTRGEGGSDLRQFVYREAKLDDAQAEKLDRIQTQYMRDVAEMDGRAKQIIEEARARRPHGQLQPGERLPEPPQELKSLQERRNNLTLRARASVREALGEQAFQNFGQFVREHVANKLRPVEPKGGRPTGLGEPGGKGQGQPRR